MREFFFSFVLFALMLLAIINIETLDSFIFDEEGKILLSFFIFSFLFFLVRRTPYLYETFRKELSLDYSKAPLMIVLFRGITIFILIAPYVYFIITILFYGYLNESVYIAKMETVGIFIYLHFARTSFKATN